jgi:hypothetical protein
MGEKYTESERRMRKKKGEKVKDKKMEEGGGEIIEPSARVLGPTNKPIRAIQNISLYPRDCGLGSKSVGGGGG